MNIDFFYKKFLGSYKKNLGGNTSSISSEWGTQSKEYPAFVSQYGISNYFDTSGHVLTANGNNMAVQFFRHTKLGFLGFRYHQEYWSRVFTSGCHCWCQPHAWHAVSNSLKSYPQYAYFLPKTSKWMYSLNHSLIDFHDIHG